MKFALGTAGWRTDYGSFPYRTLNESDARFLLDSAWNLGFELIDTAPSYGDSERLLGEINPRQSIATKVTVDSNSLSDIENSIRKSLMNLNLESIPLLFVHNWDMLTDILKVETAKILERQLDKGNILRWGVSTYDYYEIDKIRDLGFKNIVLQINSNILDQRIENVSEQVRRDLKSKNIEIWARSIFLQGILINQTPENKFLKNSDIVNFFEKSNSFNFTPIELCLNYIKQNDFIDVAIIGILSNSQLEEISKILLQSNLILDYKSFQSFDLNLVDPRRWK